MELRVFLGGKAVFASYISDRVVIGRGEGCEIRLAHPEVSYRHAEIYEEEGKWFIKDLGSSNGTFVDGIKVDCCEVKEGSEIVIHPYTLFLVENRTALGEVGTAVRRRVGVLIVDEKGRRVVDLPYEGDGVRLEEKDTEIYLVDEESGRRKRIRGFVIFRKGGRNLKIYAPGSVSIPPRRKWKVLFMLSGFLAGFITFYGEKKERLNVRMQVEDEKVSHRANDLKEIKEMLEKRDWKGVRVKIMEMMSEGRSFEGMDELLRKSYREEETNRAMEEARSLIGEGKLSEADGILSKIPEDSVYYTEAKDLRDRIIKMSRKDIKSLLPPYMELYLKGDLVNAINEANDLKVQIAISNIVSMLREAEERFNSEKFEEVISTCERVSELDRRIAGGRDGYVRRKVASLRKSSIYKLSKKRFDEGNYKEAVRHLQDGLRDYPDDRDLNGLKKKFAEMCRDLYRRAYSASEFSPENAISFLKKAEFLCVYDAEISGKVKKLMSELESK